VVVIEGDISKTDETASEYDRMSINADATAKGTSDDAGVERAGAIVSTTDRDVTNVTVRLPAEEFDVPAVTSAVHDAEHVNRVRRIGVDPIEDPRQLVAGHLHRAVARPTIIDCMQVGDGTEVFELTTMEAAPIAGKTLAEAGNANLLPDGVLTATIEHENRDEPLTPRGNTRIEANDPLVVYSAVGGGAGTRGYVRTLRRSNGVAGKRTRL